MGLDVHVYKNIKVIEGGYADMDWGSDEDFDFMAFVIDDDWKGKVKNLEYGRRYTGDRIKDVGVCYGYGSHSWFRNMLVKMISEKSWAGFIEYIQNPDKEEFIEFIDFADNEGCLDWEVSEKLYNDFVAWEERAKKFQYPDSNFHSRYMKWLEIFKAAKENKGVVVYG